MRSGQIDFGIVEGQNHDTRLQYEKFVKYELVLATSAGNKEISDTIHIQQVKHLPFVEREAGSGTLEVTRKALYRKGINSLKVTSVLGSTESIKSYLTHSSHFAFLSIHSITRQLLENQLRVIEIEGFTMDRWFYFVSRQGFQSALNKKLQQLFLQHYNQR